MFSDSVVMPAHIQFLLIVNYDLMPSFNPLWVTHRIMDAAERIWEERNRAGTSPFRP